MPLSPSATLVWRARLGGNQVLRTEIDCGPAQA